MEIQCEINFNIKLDLNEVNGIISEINTIKSYLLKSGLSLTYLKEFYDKLKEPIDIYDL